MTTDPCFPLAIAARSFSSWREPFRPVQFFNFDIKAAAAAVDRDPQSGLVRFWRTISASALAPINRRLSPCPCMSPIKRQVLPGFSMLNSANYLKGFSNLFPKSRLASTCRLACVPANLRFWFIARSPETLSTTTPAQLLTSDSTAPVNSNHCVGALACSASAPRSNDGRSSKCCFVEEDTGLVPSVRFIESQLGALTFKGGLGCHRMLHPILSSSWVTTSGGLTSGRITRA
jgi:hypothetical protein